MASHLYFIPILARALKRQDSGAAFRDAFGEIQALGQSPEYREGCQQFERFMEAAASPSDADSRDLDAMAEGLAQSLIADLVAGTFDGDPHSRALALEFIRSRDSWRAEYRRQLRHAELESEANADIEVRLEDETHGRRSVTVPREGGIRSFDGIVPGSYTLTLDTGLLLWQGALEASDLLWEEAFPEEPLAMAAETEETESQATIEEALLGGTIRMRVFPGVESGRIEVEIIPSRDREA